MPVHELTLFTVVSRLEDDCLLGQAPFFPEISACGTTAPQIRLHLAELARAVIEREPPWMISRRQPRGVPEVREIEVEQPRPAGQPSWLGPIRLRFQAVVWRHDSETVVGWVPALAINLITADSAELERRLPGEIRRALLRLKASHAEQLLPWLAKLLWLQRRQETTVAADTLLVEVRSPREIAEAEQQVILPAVLPHVADPLIPASLGAAYEVDAFVESLADYLLNDKPRSVLLVGPPGVGKTAVVHQFVRDLQRRQQDRPCWATSGSRLVAGMAGFGAWQQRCQALRDEAKRTNAVVHLGPAIELMEVGRSGSAGESIGDFLQPAIARGELVAILEATPEQARLLERDYPRMSGALTRLDVTEPEPSVVRRILRQVAAGSADDDVLELIDRLHRRFATYSACPGRPLGFLRRLIDDAPPGRRPRPTDVTRAFSCETGLPLLFLDDSLSLDLDAARNWVSERVMGQPQAVNLVVDLLATIKAGLGRPGRPIASLLFIGPTGVGKTQLAKAVAEFLYQSPDRITRIDMTEYADPLAVERLMGGLRGEGLLTSKVREQPFGVVLLDEFEKADSRFLDLLLQMLGEGRLTDAAGRTADFRNTVVVMTSNLGSDSFGSPPTGFAGAAADARGHFSDAVRRFLRPELFNRIDRIVPFLPLAEDTVERIAERELELVRRRGGIRDRGLDLDLGPGVAAAVARRGFDPRYGARPIKRAAERLVLAPLAAAINSQDGGGPRRALVRVTAPREPAEAATTLSPSEATHIEVSLHRVGAGGRPPTSLHELALFAGWCRRNGDAVSGAYQIQQMRNELFLERRLHANRMDSASRPGDSREWARAGSGLKREAVLVESLARVDAWTARSRELERQVLRGYHGGVANTDRLADELLEHSRSLRDLLEGLCAAHARPAGPVTIGLFGTSPAWMRRLARAYRAVAVARGLTVEVRAVTVGQRLDKRCAADAVDLPMATDTGKQARPQTGSRAGLLAAPLLDPEAFLASDDDPVAAEAAAAVVGLLVAVDGFPASSLFAGEAGLHSRYISSTTPDVCRVDVAPVPVAAYVAPEEVNRRSATSGLPSCREYRTTDTWEAVDKATKRRLSWRDTDVDDTRVIRIFTEHHFLSSLLDWFFA